MYISVLLHLMSLLHMTWPLGKRAWKLDVFSTSSSEKIIKLIRYQSSKFFFDLIKNVGKTQENSNIPLSAYPLIKLSQIEKFFNNVYQRTLT